VSKTLGQPKKVIWCLHDDAPIKPLRVDVVPATTMLESETKSRVIDLGPVDVYTLFD